MTTKPLHWQDITTDPLVVRIKDAGAEAIAESEGFQRRRNSLAGGAALVLQLANLLVFVNADIPLWGTIVIAVVIGLAEVIVHATSKTPVTPHVVDTLTATAQRQVMAEHWATVRPSTPAVPATPAPELDPTPQDSGLPVHTGPTTDLPHFDRD